MNTVWIGSPNFTAGRGGYAVSGFVLHWMDGNLADADATFQDRTRNTSAHYGVQDDIAHQYVQEQDTAYADGNWIANEKFIAIEHSAQPGRAPSDATYETSSQLLAAASKRWGTPLNSNTVLHHYDIIATECSGPVADGGVDEGRILTRANQILGTTPGPAPAPQPTPVSVAGVATVTVDVLEVRAAADPTSNIAGSGQLKLGQTFDYVRAVQGVSVNGISTWLVSTLGHFVWAGGTNYPLTPIVHSATGGTAEAIREAMVRIAPRVNAALGGSQKLEPGQTFTFSAQVVGDNVTENDVTSNLWDHSTKGDYVWSGNLKTV